MRENFNLSHKEVYCFCKTSVLADKRENMAEVPKKRKSSAYEVFPYYMLTQNAFRTSLNFFFFCTDRKTPNNHDQKGVIFSNRIHLHWSLFSTIIVTSGMSWGFLFINLTMSRGLPRRVSPGKSVQSGLGQNMGLKLFLKIPLSYIC